MRKKRVTILFLLFLLVGSCLCFGAILSPTETQAAPNMAGLPTRTTPNPTPLPTAIPPTSTPAPMPISTPVSGGSDPTGAAPGSMIELRVAVDSGDWAQWWTVVQWQDERGDWHDVTGWQGILDGVLKIDQLDYGTKLWWVEKHDTGSGPFRWLVYRPEAIVCGMCPMTSAPFNLPTIGQFATVDIALSESTRLATQIADVGLGTSKDFGETSASSDFGELSRVVESSNRSVEPSRLRHWAQRAIESRGERLFAWPRVAHSLRLRRRGQRTVRLAKTDFVIALRPNKPGRTWIHVYK